MLLLTHRVRERGVTLMEVLIVIGIIAVLLVLAFPALSLAKKRSGAAECVQNMRQIGLGIFQFTADHGSFPYVNVGTTRWTDGRLANYSFLAGPYLGTAARWKRYAVEGEPEAKGGIFDCPLIGAEEKEERGPEDWVTDEFDYALNITLCGRTPAEITRPGRAVMLAEGGNHNRVKAQYTHGKVYNKGNTTPTAPGGTPWNWSVTRGGTGPIIFTKGRDQAHFLFFDGHIGLHHFDELEESWFDGS